jgi:hypothetical protein
MVAELSCRELTRDDFQLILDKAPTTSSPSTPPLTAASTVRDESAISSR